jgi:hypothetical protein
MPEKLVTFLFICAQQTGQQIPCSLFNPEGPLPCVQKSAPRRYFLSDDPVYTIKIHVNVIFPMHKCFEWFHSFRLPD